MPTIILADSTQEDDIRTCSRCRHRSVGTFTATKGFDVVTGDGLSRRWKRLCSDNKINIDRSDDDNIVTSSL